MCGAWCMTLLHMWHFCTWQGRRTGSPLYCYGVSVLFRKPTHVPHIPQQQIVRLRQHQQILVRSSLHIHVLKIEKMLAKFRRLPAGTASRRNRRKHKTQESQ